MERLSIHWMTKNSNNVWCYSLHVCMNFSLINFAGSSGNTLLPKLSAGIYFIVFRFTPTDSPDAFSISKERYFKIEPTGYYYVQCTYSVNFLFLAHGSVSVSGDTATIKLYSNTDGIFMCSLDGAAFQQCIYIYVAR